MTVDTSNYANRWPDDCGGSFIDVKDSTQSRSVGSDYRRETVITTVRVGVLSDLPAMNSSPDFVAERFGQLSRRWREEIALMSSPEDMYSVATYLQLVKLGRAAIPWILLTLQSEGGHWFHLLKVLSEDDPVLHSERGNIQKMRERWLEWGRKRKLLAV